MIQTTASPVRRRRSSTSPMICCWMVTSSAVVGSSAMSTFGRRATAIAIITRWRWPPDSWWGYARAVRSGRGRPTSSSASSVRAVRLGPVQAVGTQALDDLRTDPHQRVERGHRVLVDHRDLARPGPTCGRVRTGSAARGPPRRTEPPVTAMPSGSRPITDSAVSDLPLPLSPTKATVSPARTSKDTPRTTGVRRPPDRISVRRSRTARTTSSGVPAGPSAGSFARRHANPRRGPGSSVGRRRVEGGAEPVAEQVQGRGPRRRSRRPGRSASTRRRPPGCGRRSPSGRGTASGGCVPRPRNDSADSVRIAQDSASATWTTIGAPTFGQHVAEQQAAGREAEDPAGLDVVGLADRQRGPSRDPHEDRHVDDRDGDRGVDPAPAERGDDGKRQQGGGEREQHVAQPSGHAGPRSRRRIPPPRRRACRATAASPTDTKATRSDEPIPAIVRDAMSRPNWSVPNQYDGDGPGEPVGRVLRDRVVRRDARLPQRPRAPRAPPITSRPTRPLRSCQIRPTPQPPSDGSVAAQLGIGHASGLAPRSGRGAGR